MEVFPNNVKKKDKNLDVWKIMLNFGTSNVTNCEEREISFPLLILSLESKKRHGCETPPLLFLYALLLVFYSSVFAFFPNSGSTLINAVTTNVIAQRNMTRMKKLL